MSSEGPKSKTIYPEADALLQTAYKLANQKIEEVKKSKEDIISNTLAAIKSVLESTKANNIVPISHYDIDKQMEIARDFLRTIIGNLTSQTVAKFKDSYYRLIDKNPFGVGLDFSNKLGILPKIANFILLRSIDDGIEPKIQDSVGNMLDGKKNAINYYISQRNKEIANELEQQITNLQNQIEELETRKNITEKQKQKQFDILNEQINQKEAEKKKLEKGIKISKNQIDTVVGGIKDIKDNSKIQNAALGKLLEKNKSDILNDVALRLAGNPDLKKNIRKIKGDLKAANPDYSDGDINYIISKALSENERYLKTVAANPDLFDRDMSQDTIQKENEQFQSKLRQQNLRYILPKFIERREKLVENTLNPELLKGAFAI